MVVEDLRIGRSIGAREYMFAHISGIAQLADGSVAIADSARSFAIVRRYDARGRFLNDIGRMGQGPGEYQRVTAIQVTPEGNVAIWDTRLRRVTVMTPDGDFLNSFYANSGLNSDSRVFLVGDDGSFYIQRFASPPGEPETRLVTYLKHSKHGEYVTTITLPRSNRVAGSWGISTAEGFLAPFQPEVVSTITTRGDVVAGRNDEYELEFYQGEDVRLSVAREWAPVSLHPSEHEQWTRAQEDVIRRYGSLSNGPANNQSLPTEYPSIPETKPAMQGLWPGANGTVWVRTYAEAHERADLTASSEDRRVALTWRQYPTFDAFSGEGQFLGSIVLPHDTEAVSFHPDYVWCISPEASGERTAVRFNILKHVVPANAAGFDPRD